MDAGNNNQLESSSSFVAVTIPEKHAKEARGGGMELQVIATLESNLGLAPNEPVDKPKSPKAQAPAKREKKEKKEKAPVAAAAPAEEQAEITKLDIRVGKIVNVWKHETADKLYCEEIDVGEDAPRQIASGLVKHYTLEQMQGRLVLVMCNLKARNLVGFKSHGMVLCAVATNADGSESVAFVEPPAGAVVGERVTYDGVTGGEPWTPAQVEKKKVLVSAGEGLVSDAEGVAKWNDHVMLTSAGPCTSPSIRSGILR
ncbi:hypothetical protein DYB37_006599 [Aphanomyces astaci]|uniref:tRNA-binding domain-containing protein n=1 Tax=Aphanomyces astaci TaxID=112090 RepID=A0A397EZY8_APHAT|nr:hypothetical protein DYB35_004019 [Aphanomyces astaci]RHZ10382.1 hypothetical protein DYB31_002790 [Aphanomyces astaci]RHZ26555.1 hypothetical protein DYB37_006599 [Aphanomyces astaci]